MTHDQLDRIENIIGIGYIIVECLVGLIIIGLSIGTAVFGIGALLGHPIITCEQVRVYGVGILIVLLILLGCGALPLLTASLITCELRIRLYQKERKENQNSAKRT